MNKSHKAAMLSAFVFPGVGHLSLKRYISGGTILAVAAVATMIVIGSIMSRAIDIAHRIQSGEISTDLASVIELLRQQTEIAHTPVASIATYILIASWLVAVIDSYRIGK